MERKIVVLEADKKPKGPIDPLLFVKFDDYRGQRYSKSAKDGLWFPTNGFPALMFRAYSAELPIILNPGYFLVSLLAQISEYIGAHPEKCRGTFVNFEGKQEVNVNVSDCGIDYRAFLAAMDQKTRAATKGTLDFAVNTKFTTDTMDIDTAKQSSILSCLKHYFSYGMTLSCGFGTVLFEGTDDDWQKLQGVVGNFRRLFESSTFSEIHGFLKNYEALLGHVVATRGGENRREWWSKFITKQKQFGSGSQAKIDGWAKDLVYRRTQKCEKSDLKDVCTFPVTVTVPGADVFPITWTTVLGGFTTEVHDGVTFYRPTVYHKCGVKNSYEPQFEKYMTPLNL